MDVRLLANEALLILRQSLDVVPLILKNEEETIEQILDVTMEIENSITDPKNQLILPACSMLAMEINNRFPIGGCEFTRLELTEGVIEGAVTCYEGISIRLEKQFNMEIHKKGVDILCLSVGVSKRKDNIRESNTMVNPITLIVTDDEFTLHKKGESLTIENIISYKDGLEGDRVKTFNKRELKKIAKFIMDSILQEE